MAGEGGREGERPPLADDHLVSVSVSLPTLNVPKC